MSVATNKPAPQSPRLSIYRWRLTMIASLAHRASGIVLALGIPTLLWMLLTMSHNPGNFTTMLGWLHHPMGQFSLWATATALCYHFINGIRFLCLDIGIGESRDSMKLTAKLVLVVTVVFSPLFLVLL